MVDGSGRASSPMPPNLSEEVRRIGGLIAAKARH